MALPGIAEFTAEFFDESSRGWMANKIRAGHGVAYRCEYIHTNGKSCIKARTVNTYCKRHYVLSHSKKRAR